MLADEMEGLDTEVDNKKFSINFLDILCFHYSLL
jgi:hypothetical protein